jgi:glucokinase
MIWAAGIDIGGTHAKAVAISCNGVILERTSRETGPSHCQSPEWIAKISGVISALEQKLESPPAAVGICAPGLASSDERTIAFLPGKLPGLAGIDWTHALNRDSLVPVLNDAHAAILGEAWIGAARGYRNAVMVTLGTGVGGAVICNGELLRGAIGRAGHIGHMSLDPEGEKSITGMPGAIEVMFGECTLPQRSSGRFTRTSDLIAAHVSGDVDSTRIWLKSVRALACALGSCINLFDPEILVLGGGISQAGEVLLAPLERELERVEWRPGGHRVPLVFAALGEWAGAIGVAQRALADKST